MRAAMIGMMLAALGLSGSAYAQHTSGQDEQILQQGSTSGSGGTEPAPPMVEDEEMSTTYSTIGLQKVAADFDNVKDAINLDFTMIGFRIPTINWFAIELNLGFTMAPGQITQSTTSTGTGCGGLLQPPCTSNTATSQSDFTTTTVGAFGVLRSPGSVYVMGKAGYRYMNTSLDQLQNDRSGTAWGAGIGYRWNKKGSFAELGYTKIADKISGIGFSISYSYDRR